MNGDLHVTSDFQAVDDFNAVYQGCSDLLNKYPGYGRVRTMTIWRGRRNEKGPVVFEKSEKGITFRNEPYVNQHRFECTCVLCQVLYG